MLKMLFLGICCYPAVELRCLILNLFHLDNDKTKIFKNVVETTYKPNAWYYNKSQMSRGTARYVREIICIVRMEVPGCGEIQRAAENALKAIGKFIHWQIITVSVDGNIIG